MVEYASKQENHFHILQQSSHCKESKADTIPLGIPDALLFSTESVLGWVL